MVEMVSIPLGSPAIYHIINHIKEWAPHFWWSASRTDVILKRSKGGGEGGPFWQAISGAFCRWTWSKCPDPKDTYALKFLFIENINYAIISHHVCIQEYLNISPCHLCCHRTGAHLWWPQERIDLYYMCVLSWAICPVMWPQRGQCQKSSIIF